MQIKEIRKFNRRIAKATKALSQLGSNKALGQRGSKGIDISYAEMIDNVLSKTDTFDPAYREVLNIAAIADKRIEALISENRKLKQL